MVNMTQKIVYQNIPSIYIPPVHIRSEDIGALENNRDTILKVAKIHWYHEYGARRKCDVPPVYLERWVIKNCGGLPVTFYNKVCTLEAELERDPAATQDVDGKYPSGNDFIAKLYTWNNVLKPVSPYATGGITLTQKIKGYDYHYNDEMVEALTKENVEEEDKARKFCLAHIGTLWDCLYSAGYIDGQIDFNAVVEAIADHYTREQ